jgi:hypothetical protein
VGSLRTPVGPLPSSIYWRRRLVVLLLIALLVLILAWALTSGGGASEPAGDDDQGGGPAESITPGPTPSESFIDERPGGRDESSDDGGTGDGSSGSGGSDGDGDGGATGGSGSGGVEGEGSGGEPPVYELADCGPDDVTLSLLSAADQYPLGEDPELNLTVDNVSGVSCRVDFGYGSLTVSIADAEDEEVWSSVECPAGSVSEPAAVPAGSSVTHTITWDRRHSTSDCDGPTGPEAAAGTYLAEATLSGFSEDEAPQAAVTLDND